MHISVLSKAEENTSFTSKEFSFQLMGYLINILDPSMLKTDRALDSYIQEKKKR